MFSNITTADFEAITRTVAENTVAPGDSTTVELVMETEEGEPISLDPGELVRVDESFSPGFADVEVVGRTPGGGSDGSGDGNEELIAIWNEEAEEYLLSYEVTIPSGASTGSTFDITGTLKVAGSEQNLPEATITAEEPMPDVTGVELRPAEATGLVDDETTLELVVTGADEGIGSYAIDLSLDDTGVATFADVALTNPAETDDSTVADDSVTVEATLSEPHDAVASIPIAELTLDTGDEGETNIDVDSAAVSDPSDSEYNIEETAGATLAVTDGPPQLPGAEGPPQDINGDGLFEDVNGDGVVNIADVQFLFDNLEELDVQDNAEFYDFSGTGGDVTIFDIQALFNRSQDM